MGINVMNVLEKRSTDISTETNIFATPTPDLTLGTSTMTLAIPITMTSEESGVKTTLLLILHLLIEDKTVQERFANVTNGFLMLFINMNPTGANLGIESGLGLLHKVNLSSKTNVTFAKDRAAAAVVPTTILCAAETSLKVPGYQLGLMVVPWTAVTTVLMVVLNGSVNTSILSPAVALTPPSPNTARRHRVRAQFLSTVKTSKWMYYFLLMSQVQLDLLTLLKT